MAGMLAGVECARRRRLRHPDSQAATVGQSRTRRSSLCLYPSNYETHLTSSSSLLRNASNHGSQGEKLEGVAKEAKERLDGKLRNQRKLEGKRCNSKGDVQIEVFATKKSRSFKKFSWAKFGWKASDQDECAICLEWFETGDTLVHLPCAHRFHSRCIVPWIETNAHCPCCRMSITYNA
ncbi:hypothetical protein GIB67_020133 [Kingdonia uniflora]|uniref:RING-type domain-containing protein n=1 Tax=Kingdonia uniflora TaxID=39325 RepID=A0A7J7NIU8_9MAGN|nr:hypothetical protein GIB67_020133 [Kingdonia uniflora]